MLNNFKLDVQNEITKEVSCFLYGVAILLMIYHHLVLHNLSNAVWIEKSFCSFCKICVAIYAFISGYALQKKVHYQKDSFVESIRENVTYIVKKVFKLYSKLWLVALIFVPIGLITGRLEYDKKIILIFLGKNIYNSAWWYFGQYIKMLLMYIVIDAFIVSIWDKVKCSSKCKCVGVFLLLALMLFLFPNMQIVLLLLGHIPYTIIFWEGYCIAKFRMFDKMNYFISIVTKRNSLLAILMILIIVVCRIVLADGNMVWKWGDIVLGPLFIYNVFIFMQDNRFAHSMVCKGIYTLGKCSTFMWLTHMFYIQYLEKYFLKLNNTFLIFSYVVLISFVGAKILTYLEKKYVMKIVKKFNIIVDKVGEKCSVKLS